jgi:nicotinamide riboside transporter PnuC
MMAFCIYHFPFVSQRTYDKLLFSLLTALLFIFLSKEHYFRWQKQLAKQNLGEEKNMKSANNRILAFSITLIFLLIMLFPLDALPSVAAHYPEWKIPTYAYIHVAPNPVGVGQQIFIMVWVSAPGVGPMPGSNMNNNIRYHNYKGRNYQT